MFSLTKFSNGTVLNFGTSGKVWLNVPNSFVQQAEIESKRPLAIPGSGTLPYSGLDVAGLEYVEAGPAGWESMVVLVSEHPLIDAAIVRCSSPHAPLVQLERNDLDTIGSKLAAMASRQWSAAVLTFLVEA